MSLYGRGGGGGERHVRGRHIGECRRQTEERVTAKSWERRRRRGGGGRRFVGRKGGALRKDLRVAACEPIVAEASIDVVDAALHLA